MKISTSGEDLVHSNCSNSHLQGLPLSARGLEAASPSSRENPSADSDCAVAMSRQLEGKP